MTLSLVAFALQTQAGKPIHPGHKAVAPVIQDTKPVNGREAVQAFDRLVAYFQRVNGAPLGTVGVPSLDRPVTRAEIVVEMTRILNAASPTLRFTPAHVSHDPSVLRIDRGQKAALEALVSLGCVARIGPLALGPLPTLTPKEFGDSLGFFMARLAQMSHLPSPKWTPMLKDE